jgi:hypothetical protein
MDIAEQCRLVIQTPRRQNNIGLPAGGSLRRSPASPDRRCARVVLER